MATGNGATSCVPVRGDLNGASATVKPTGVARLGTLETRWELVTKETADKYLACHVRNRRLMENLSNRYAGDMGLGQWLTTHQGVAFDENGALVDGRHRLTAVSLSGVPQHFLVTRGLSPEAIEVLDRGKLRTLAHAMQIMGHDMASPRAIAIARSMIVGCGNRHVGNQVSDMTVRKFIDEQRDAILFACGCISKSLAPASIAAVVARAFNHAKTAQLERFGLALADQIANEDMKPGDKTARMLSRAILASRSGASGGATRATLYKKGQNALRSFLDGQDLQKLHEAQEDLFPLPVGLMESLAGFAAEAKNS